MDRGHGFGDECRPGKLTFSVWINEDGICFFRAAFLAIIEFVPIPVGLRWRIKIGLDMEGVFLLRADLAFLLEIIHREVFETLGCRGERGLYQRAGEAAARWSVSGGRG